MQLSKILAIAAMAAFGFANATQASIIWDGLSNTVLENPPDGTNNNSTLAISQETTFSTAGGFQSPASDGSVYTGGVGAVTSPGNPDFYSSKDNTAVTNYTIFDGGSNDLLGRVQVAGGTSGTGISSMYAWEFDEDTLEAFGSTGFGGFGGNVSNAQYRFVFQDSLGDWHASDSTFTGDGDIADVTTADWVSFTPHTAGVAIIGAPSTPSFDGVQLVGYYQQFDTTGGGGMFSTGFSASGSSVIPEPSTVALLGLGAVGAVLFRRRMS